MSGAIDVHVKSDPDSCRALAGWLKQLAAKDEAAAGAAIRTSGASETIWTGEAGENFRNQLRRASRDVDELVEGIEWLARGLDRFADDIQSVRSGMQHCVEMAHEAGLAVNGTAIQEPAGGADDGAFLAGPDDPQHMAIAAKHNAYWSIQKSVEDLRNQERTAHRSLLKCINGGNGIADSLLSNPQTWISRFFVSVGTVRAAANGLSENADSQRAFAEKFAQLSEDSTIPAAQREQTTHRLLANAGMDDAAADSNSRLLLGGANTKAGSYIADTLSGTLAPRNEKSSLPRTGKLFNIAAFGSAAIFTITDIANGKPLAKSAWVNFGGLTAGTAASSGFSAAATQGGLLSVASAPITLASLGVGFTATSAFNYFQDHDMRDLYRDLSDDGGNSATDNSDEYRKARYGH